MPKKVLVIGGCGFIGSHIVDGLLATGTAVRVLDRRPEAFREQLPGVEYIFGDFSDPFQLLESLEGVDAVMHCASTTVPSTSNVDPVSDISGNLISSVRLLKLLRQMNITKLVYLSSGGTVYGVPQTATLVEVTATNSSGVRRPVSTPSVQSTASRSSTPFEPFGMMRKSSRPRRFCSVVKAQ